MQLDKDKCCVGCGRDFSDEPETHNGPCPSDDCPSNEVSDATIMRNLICWLEDNIEQDSDLIFAELHNGKEIDSKMVLKMLQSIQHHVME